MDIPQFPNGINLKGEKGINAAPGTAGTDLVNLDQLNAAIAGGVTFIGGYNAATNTPDLETPAPGAVKKGYLYVVTVAGDFFTEAMEVGDMLISEVDDPSALGDWIRVNKNIDPTAPHKLRGTINNNGGINTITMGFPGNNTPVGLQCSNLLGQGINDMIFSNSGNVGRLTSNDPNSITIFRRLVAWGQLAFESTENNTVFAFYQATNGGININSMIRIECKHKDQVYVCPIGRGTALQKNGYLEIYVERQSGTGDLFMRNIQFNVAPVGDQ